MRRAVAHYLPREMAVLGLLECVLCFAVIDMMLPAMVVPTNTLSVTAGAITAGDAPLAAALTVVVGAVAVAIGLYRPAACFRARRLLIATGLAAILAYTGLRFLTEGSHAALAGTGAFSVARLLAACLAAMALIRLAYVTSIGGRTLHPSTGARRVLLLGDPDRVAPLGIRLRSRRGRGFDPVVLLDRAVSWTVLRQRGIWGVVIASEPESSLVEPLLDCKLRGIQVFSHATFQETYLGRIDLETLTADGLLKSHGFVANRAAEAVKRLCDIVIGTTMLVLTLPLLTITALAIKIDSPGAMIYRQQRVGQFGKTFTLLKFRSMSADAESGGDPRWAQKHDPRVTRVGRFIRATRIDELPQLVNVLRGEMSLVGPRPERPHFVEQLTRSIPFYQHRSYVKPGLTGWAQVNFPYGASVEDAREKLAYDLYYVKNRTLMLDAITLLSTVRVVLSREGAR